uniref:Proopiomelanocortin b n=1 Tax=Cyprinus carpio TaxID=7962 RepID=A0A8C2HI03_CYPCA
LVSCFQMLCPSWLLAAAVLCFHSPHVEGRCLDLIDCMGLKTNEQKLVRFILTQESSNYGRVSASEQQNSEEEVEEESLSLGLLLSALSPDSTELRDRRSYSMQHFRWGKPMGRKRRPIKVITSSALEEEPEESAESVRMERGQNGMLDVQQRKNAKSNGKYRMTHFRWNTPPTSSLLTLIRNIIVKDAQQFRD